MPVIIVNATALDSSGALTILKQFVASTPINEFDFVIFISDKVNLSYSQSNIRLVKISNVKSFYRRFLWDTLGVRLWLKRNNVKPFASLSLQNTNFLTGNSIPNYIYYHQPIRFYSQKWSFLEKEQRILWFYKKIYPFFVQIFINKKTKIFVQLECIKFGFSKRFNFPKNRISVITPKFELPSLNPIKDIELPKDKINIFYPATTHFYKNHSVVVDALKLLNDDKIVLYLTCSKEELNVNTDNINVKFCGKMPFEDVLGMYKMCDALIFPSYIETYGLPLLEAASLGLLVLVADLPYSREVLFGYEGARFIDYSNSEIWANEISRIKKGEKFSPFYPPTKESWATLFEKIKTKY